MSVLATLAPMLYCLSYLTNHHARMTAEALVVSNIPLYSTFVLDWVFLDIFLLCFVVADTLV